jgi:methionyl aminopeptidase
MTEAITRHTAQDFEGMRRAGYLAARVLDYIGDYVDVGVSTERLNTLCHDYIIQHGAIPAPLNYKGFPKSICTSVNHVVCHGIPSPDKILQNGDIINIDVTVIVDGWHGDTSRMYTVGKAKGQARKLVEVTYECLMRGIDQVKPGARFGDIGYVIQSYAESFGFSVVRDFCGHGIGKIFHEAPSVLHYGKKGEGTRLEEGMFFTIEPMINVGTWRIKVLSDGWTAITQDRKLSAQFEHTLGVTSSGHEIFTV